METKFLESVEEKRGRREQLKERLALTSMMVILALFQSGFLSPNRAEANLVPEPAISDITYNLGKELRHYPGVKEAAIRWAKGALENHLKAHPEKRGKWEWGWNWGVDVKNYDGGIAGIVLIEFDDQGAPYFLEEIFFNQNGKKILFISGDEDSSSQGGLTDSNKGVEGYNPRESHEDRVSRTFESLKKAGFQLEFDERLVLKKRGGIGTIRPYENSSFQYLDTLANLPQVFEKLRLGEVFDPGNITLEDGGGVGKIKFGTPEGDIFVFQGESVVVYRRDGSFTRVNVYGDKVNLVDSDDSNGNEGRLLKSSKVDWRDLLSS
jgi:hypothetical protein